MKWRDREVGLAGLPTSELRYRYLTLVVPDDIGDQWFIQWAPVLGGGTLDPQLAQRRAALAVRIALGRMSR